MERLSESVKPYVKPEIADQLQRQEHLDAAFALETNADAVTRARAGLPPKAMAEFNAATLQNMAILEDDMARNPPKSGWVLNLHPWAIRTNSGRLMRDVVPRCEILEIGQDEPNWAFLEIPWHEIDMRPQVDASYSCAPILPIVQAGQYMREGNTNELWGPGIMIYEGLKSPEEMWDENAEIQVFTDRGWPITSKVKAMIRQRGSREPVPGERLVPVTKPFREIYKELRQRRNDAYLRLVKEVDDHYHGAEGKEKRWYLNAYVRAMAQMLVAERLLPKLPAWNLETMIEAGLTEESCKRCGAARQRGAISCQKCNTPFDIVAALKAGFIDFDYPGIRFLAPEQLADVLRLKKEVDDNQKRANLILAREAKEKKEVEEGAGAVKT
jgi:hypothetical protein